MAKLPHLSEVRLEQLRAEVEKDIDRYRGNGFADLVREPGWSIDIDLDLDLTELQLLDGSDNRAATDLNNSRIVARVLKELSPSLANEERIWVRLSHVEAFSYCRDRWLKGLEDPQAVADAVRLHFFARTQTGLRDDHAISRLWWNAYIARHSYPHDPDRGLELLLTTADVRSNLVERIWLTGRRKLATGVFRSMESDTFVLSSERSFREFMKAINLLGGGIVFEAMTDTEIDAFLTRCSAQAAADLAASAAAKL
jgi:hypothetical protein